MSQSQESEVCPNCQKILMNRVFDRCLYCGENLPPSLCLSDAEKNILRDQMARNEEEKDSWKSKGKKPGNGSPSGILTTSYGDGCDSAGGGDCGG